MTAEKVAISRIRRKLRKVQRVGEDGGESVPTTTVGLIELARESIETKRKNATMCSRQKDLEVKLVDIRAAKRAMRGLITAAENWIKL